MGKAMIDYAARGDIVNFQRLLEESEDKELMYWHVTKSLKAAVKNKHVDVTRYIIDELNLDLDHEAFHKYLHLFLFSCQEVNFLQSEEEKEEASQTFRELLRLLVKGKGPSAIDEVDNVNQSTALMMACENLTDIELIKILVEEGKADINAVNSDDKLPLTVVKERIEKLEKDLGVTPEQEVEPGSELGKVRALNEYLKSKGAVLNWRDRSRGIF
jgi:hypothetical protein